MLPKISLLLSGLTFIIFLGGVLLANKEIIPATAGMVLFLLGGVLGLLGAILAVFVLLKTDAIPIAMLGFLGLLPVLVVFAAALQGNGAPMINDVSTDVEDPPQFTHAQTLVPNTNRDMAFPIGNAEIIKVSYPDLHPLQTTKTPAETYQLALSVARKMPRWEITLSDESAGVIEGVDTTRLFHWRDDFVIRVRTTTDGYSIIDMRSKSRDGKGDFGANAKRIQTYFDKLVENIVASS